MAYCPECSASVPKDAEYCPTCGAALAATPPTSDGSEAAPDLDIQALEKPLAAALAPRYELLKLLGAGGMGAVFLAREAELKRLVAVKVLAPTLASEPSARARFQREARTAAALSHPNVVRVYAVGETRTHLPYIVMQYVEGASLTDWIRARGRVPERDARRIIGEVAAALAAAHARDLVHRDVKPANVLIEAESGRAVVADFGVSAAQSPAGRQDTRLTVTGAIMGTPPYMSPEQAAGDPVTPKSDIYSLGVLAYELLTGRPPFTASTLAGWAAAHLRDTPEPVTRRRSELTPQLARLVERCLSKVPSERPAAVEVARTLLPSLETAIPWPPPGLGTLFGRARVLTRELLITSGAGLLVLLALAFTPDALEVHARWLSSFGLDPLAVGAMARARVPPDSSQVTFFVWQTALILGSAVFLLGVLYLSAVVHWLRRLLGYRALGWTWVTLSDVAADPDGRSGALLAGGDEFGFLDESERRGILRARRFQVAWLFAAGLWLLVGLGVWIGGAALGLLGGDITAPLAGTPGVAIVLGPMLPLLIAADLAERTERRLLGPVSPRSAATVTPVEVKEWYRSVPGTLAGSSDPRISSRSRTLHRGAVVVALAAAVVMVLGLGEIVLASVAAARFVQSVAPRAAELNASVRRLSAADPYGATRQLLAAVLPVQGPLPDTTARRLIRQLFNQDSLEALPPAPWVDQTLLGPPPREAALQEAVQRAFHRRLPAETVALIDQAAAHPRAEAFRVLARASSVDFLGALLDHPVAGYSGVEPIVPASVSPLIQAAHLNTLAAIGALQRGDASAAAARLGETAAVVLHLFEAPLLAPHAYGLLRREVLSPLASLAEAQGGSEEARALRAARDALVALRPDGLGFGIAGLAADAPDMPLLARVVVESPLPVGERVALLMNGWAGLCGSPREILSGPSGARDARLFALADSVESPYAHDLVRLARRRWAEPASAFGTGGPLSGLVNHGPWATALRMLWCAVGDYAAR